MATAGFGDERRRGTELRPVRQCRTDANGCGPSAPLSWKSLARSAQPLTFSVAERAPPSHLLGLGSSPPCRRARSRSLRHGGLTRPARTVAARPRLRGHGTHGPERLESYRNPPMDRRANRPRPGVVTRCEAVAHPFARFSPRGSVNRLSVPTELDQPRARGLATSARSWPEMLPANSCIPRCQRRAPELRASTDSLC